MSNFQYRHKVTGELFNISAATPFESNGLAKPGRYKVSPVFDESVEDLVLVQPTVRGLVEIGTGQTIGIPMTPIIFRDMFWTSDFGEDEFTTPTNPGWGTIDPDTGELTGTPDEAGAADFVVRCTHIASGLFAEIAFTFNVASTATVPSAPGTLDWEFLNAAAPGGGEAIIRINAVPADGGSPILTAQREINGGAAVNLSGIDPGDYPVTGLANGVSASCRIRFVNAINANPSNWSGSKSTTPTATATYVPEFVDTGGTGHLRKEGNIEFADSAFFGLRILVRSLTNLAAVATSQVLNSASDIWNVRFINNGDQLRVSLKDTAGTTVVDWTSGTGQKVAGQKLYFIRMTLSPVVFAVELNGTNITGSGTFTTSPIAGSGLFDHRTSAGTTSDYALGARRDGTVVADLEWADASIDVSTVVAGSLHYSGGVPKDPVGIGAPALILKGNDFFSGVNRGNGQDWTPFAWGETDPSLLLPEPMIGFGANATGGIAGPTYYVENTNDSGTGSFRWACLQSGPGYVVPVIEGTAYLSSGLTMPANKTVIGHAAPGSGFKITGNRVDFEGSNEIWRHIEFFGNRSIWNDSADCVRGGIYGGNGGAITQNIYIAHCGFYHGKDETFTSNGDANANPDNIYRNVSNVYNVIGTPIGNDISGAGEKPHNYCWFHGSGSDRVTNMFNLCSRGTARNPLFDDSQTAIEHFCNATYNFPCGTVDGHSGLEMMRIRDLVEISLRNNDFRMGPNYQGLTDFIVFESSGNHPTIFIDGNIRSTKIGKVPRVLHGSSHTFAAAQTFTGSGVALVPADQVEGVLVAEGGARGYGGVRRSYADEHIMDYAAGDRPTGYHLYTNGPIPTHQGKTYPPCTVIPRIPDSYRVLFPGDTDPNATINDNSAYDDGKHKVIDRIADFLASPLNTWNG